MSAATLPIRFSRRRFYAATTMDIDLIRQLDALLGIEDYNSFSLRPTWHAYYSARRYLANINRIVYPTFTPDGEGGLDIEWEYQGRHLALSCRASNNENDFISWREPTEQYEGEPASPFRLNERLDWLTR